MADDLRAARQSLSEERTAISDYRRRLKAADHPGLRQTLQHAIPEEREHARLFGRVVHRLQGRR